MGNFPVAIYYKLMEGLKKTFDCEKERKAHILKNMLYMAEINEKNCFIIKEIFGITNDDELNLYHGDSSGLDIKEKFGIEKIDIVIGNPPYNEELITKKGSATALYSTFVKNNIDNCDLLCFVIPSRWFSGGKGLNTFRKDMLKRNDIVYMKHYDDASKIFGNSVSIKGGVNYFLKDTKHNGDCMYNGSMTKLNKYDVFVDSKYYDIIDNVSNSRNLDDIFIGQSYSGINSNDTRLKDVMTNTSMKCYVSQQKGFHKYIEVVDINKDRDFDKWKVITTRSSHTASSGFGNTFIGKPNEICNQSYVLFVVESENEAKSLLSYMKCKLPNFMLSLRKSSQDICESTCKWIPLPPLDRQWTDNDIYKHFKLTDDDMKLVKETKIIGYKDVIQDAAKTVFIKVKKTK
jgi:site-specific DNA-methyltransferase (adenine-specific)